MAYSKRNFELEAMCVGFSRTGTCSMRFALETLCGGRCLHMFYNIHLDLASPISKILSGEMSDSELKMFFEKYDFRAAADFPFLGFWEQTIELFPNSKVILTIRDPETWVMSVKNTLALRHGKNSYRKRFPYNLFRYLPSKLNKASNMVEDIPLLMDLLDAVNNGRGVEFYNNWIEHVKSKVPKDRLLIYEVKDGWEPLCKFLNKPIPDTPFPKSNDKESLKEHIIDKQMKREALIVMSLAAVPLALALGAMAFKYSNEVASILGGWLKNS